MDYSSKLGELNKKHGLVVCGYQRGGDDSHAKNDPCDKNKYFSELPYDFQKDLIKWFGLWEYPLATEESKMGNFEKSIIEIEWCEGHSKTIDKNLLCSTQSKERFLKLIESLEPKLLMFTGTTMLDALNDSSLKPSVEKILGHAKSEPQYFKKSFEYEVEEETENGMQTTTKKTDGFRVGFQSFDKCEVIALPHPTGTIGLPNQYLALFKDEIKPLIDEYRKSKGV
ncbi:hypothetical protein [Helicobacter cetorum]|uniref:hypothetical protein n=1 Tax=Helicobacter cetorum TaxID=138563 RepID=UPI000CF0FBCE|nr:hypothetical protein [Helicobacter cetorum]